MQLEINLGGTGETQETASTADRVKEAQNKKADAKYIPTWEEVWITGYTRHTGTRKKGIFQTSLSNPDKKRLKEVKLAIEAEELGIGVEDLNKFTKAHALRLYEELKEIRRGQVVKEMIANKPDNYYLVNTQEQLDELVRLLELEEIVALDTETTGLKWEDMTVGMSLTLPVADKHFYIPYDHKTTYEQIPRDIVMRTMKKALEREGLKLVMFNSKFDVHMLKKDGIDLIDNNYFDVLIAMHILNENEPSYQLKRLANKYGKYFGYHDDSMTFEELFGRDPIHFIEADLELAMIYACKDTHLTYLFYEFQMEMFNKNENLKDVYFNIEQPNTAVAITMEDNGFKMDLDFAYQYQKELKEQLDELEANMLKNWGDVNTNSPKQLAELFFDELGYEDVSGKRSVNKTVLKQLANEHDDVKDLLDYRDLSKLYSTYIEPLPSLIRKDVEEKGLKGDGRLHGQFNQIGTVTGRWSSSDPNLQNIPDRARQMFIADEGNILIGLDYS